MSRWYATFQKIPMLLTAIYSKQISLYIFGSIHESITGICDFNTRRLFWEQWTLLLLAITEHDNNDED